jgi:hypothetical protein
MSLFVCCAQGQLVGSILSNLLLVLGLCFLVGGIKNRPEQVWMGWDACPCRVKTHAGQSIGSAVNASPCSNSQMVF